ncbi:hypothetical protein AB5I41_22405 [Sphingomonas sp. MMS24-JH45]
MAGYVRRSAINAEVSTAGVNGTNGYGVRIAGIQRSGDIFKTQAVRTRARSSRARPRPRNG